LIKLTRFEQNLYRIPETKTCRAFKISLL